ncbi:MAG TPA: pyrroline-5-carboxylate reductase, partial [Pseudomonadales bacterium]|nr:pyrroline-5-carboxylate reductase [Pseudomonadales bacterium]
QNTKVAEEGAVVVLAVKPQQMAQVVSELAPVLQKTQPLIISIAAGITSERIQQWAGYDAAVVRCMPNTPALVLTGATGMFANAKVEEHQKQLAKSILGAVGIALWVPQEDQLDAVTALSGSGPAYFFLVMEAMMAAGKQMGLDDASVRQLTLQTALGAAQMAITSADDPAELRRKVTSPGGTTEQAIKTFEEGGLRELFSKALLAAERRSKELAQLN